MPGKSCSSPINSANKARPTPLPAALFGDVHPPNPAAVPDLLSAPAKESGHADELAIDKSTKNKVVVGRDQAISDRLQGQGPMLGCGFREGLRLPLQRFVAKLPVRLGIEVGEAANLHGQLPVKQSPVLGS